jgi:hypothetical protein
MPSRRLLRDRLSSVFVDAGGQKLSKREIARRLWPRKDATTQRRVVQNWLDVDGTSRPERDHLELIARRFAVSVDYLLGLSDQPSRNQQRTPVELAEDLAAFLREKVAAATGTSAEALYADGYAVLAQLAKREAEHFLSYRHASDRDRLWLFRLEQLRKGKPEDRRLYRWFKQDIKSSAVRPSLVTWRDGMPPGAALIRSFEISEVRRKGKG